MGTRTRVVVVVLLLGLALSLAAGPNWALIGTRIAEALARIGLRVSGAEPERGDESLALPALPAEGWVNAAPVTLESLRAKIAVVAIFSGTNPRTAGAMARVQAWSDAYSRFGVQVVGVHSPEYSFATTPEAARRVVDRLAITFPVVHDPSLRVLAALHSTSSDVQVLVAGPDGRVEKPRFIRDPALDAARIEDVVRRLIREQHPDVAFPEDLAFDPVAPEATPADVRTVRLAARSVSRGPLANVAAGRAMPFTAQFRHQIEGESFVPYPVGWWLPNAESLEARQGGAANFVAIRYHAARVGVVAAPPATRHARLWILLDEEWIPRALAGPDVRHDSRGASYVDVSEPRLLLIFRGDGEHVLKVSPDEAGTVLYAFTFEDDAPRPTR
jgi:hypothetical protein